MKVIAIDSNALCHRVKHTLGDLTHETKQVGVIFGFFNNILSLAKKLDTNQFAFLWDSRTSLRVKEFPGYKATRRAPKKCEHGFDTPEDCETCIEQAEIDKAAYAQFDLLRDKYLNEIGFKNNFHADGYEGDDLIASLIDWSDVSINFVIASGDEDMYQCLGDGIDILNGKGIYTAKMFTEEYGIQPENWCKVKALAGCKSDEVPNIPGIGEVNACKYINGTLSKGKKYESIISPAGKEIYKRNLPLVTLPYPGCPKLEFKKDDHLSLDAFMDMCKELNFQYFLRKETLQLWKERLNMR